VDAPAITCRALTKRYRNVVALDSLDLEVPQHSLFGFLGPNGAGKTTLMRVLLGLARPTSGSGEVLGHDITRETLEVRKLVGYLPQQPRFHEDLTSRELLRYARGFFPHDPDARIEDDITEVLDLVGLTAKADSLSGELSGGQRQRLGIAQAQIHRPPLLVLDEPAAALDPLGRRDVLEVMRRLKESTTVFYSTHILDDVQQVSDQVAILKQGRRVLQAPMDELLAGEGHPAFVLSVSGDVARAAETLREQPWVVGVGDARGDGDAERTTLSVQVTDEELARRRLLRLVLQHDDVQVLDFGPRRSELEDVFIETVEGVRQ
jgi:ABC-2 type transport system ATP-binding protein